MNQYLIKVISLNPDDFGYLVFDNEGSFELEGEVMEFDLSGEDVVVEYNLYVEGSIDDEGYAVAWF